MYYINMKDILLQYAMYSSWSNERITNMILSLDESLVKQIIPSSFPSLYDTIYHVWESGLIWWLRLNPELSSVHSLEKRDIRFDKLVGMLQTLDKDWIDWVKDANEDDFLRQLDYKNKKGEPFRQPVFELLMQVFNHQTYHRGQLVTMLRMLGVTNIPGTDYITFSRIVQ
ncbi:MAG: hypothetical protein C5B52_16145 [Bacteroidetes bacterium]|nr:MAG: hypothetical protein C5B52_16145 [Bacteroidota bacterium]